MPLSSAPSARERPPLVLAHRGARTVAPENTIEAFRVALAQGADGVELDVHRTSDRGLVVHHDADAEGLGVLADLDLPSIRRARPDIPTLGEVLDVCTGSLVNIEIKNSPGDADFDESVVVADLVVALLEERGGGDEVLVSSFHEPTVERVHTLAAVVSTGLLTFFGLDPIEGVARCAELGLTAFHPFLGLLAGDGAVEVVTRGRELGVAVNVWTVNDESEMARLADAGVDAIVTDTPDIARGVLGAR